MQYISTRDREQQFSASQAIAKGLADDGGLLTPVYLPKLPRRALEELKDMSYQQRAVYVMKLFLDEFTVKELTDFANAAYGPEKFDTPAVAPVRGLDSSTFCLELWHGPTCAFKDMALQMLPHLLTASLRKQEEEKTVCILVATSGDTGKGALEGFKDVDHTRILVFYPKDGVSAIQELQMVTQEGGLLCKTAAWSYSHRPSAYILPTAPWYKKHSQLPLPYQYPDWHPQDVHYGLCRIHNL